jgi:uncharacterized protein
MRRLIGWLAIGGLLAACQTTGGGVRFPDALGRPQDPSVTGQLNIPSGSTGPVPVVVIAHGSGGVDGRGAYHASALNAAGIATLEIDMHSRWGFTGGPRSRTNTGDGLIAVYGALQYLGQHPAVDAKRVGLMGFSLGGNITLAARSDIYIEQYGRGLRFVAFAPLYAPCASTSGYQSSEPLQMHLAELDDYESPDVCTNMVRAWLEPARATTEIIIHKDAPHGFDMVGRASVFFDPNARRQGGQVKVYRVESEAQRARDQVVAFFRKAFGM